ncbi:hypothetical protein ACQEVF_25620 [Nonomuraea polychroma]|uniref:hypothetical protein n=1 Tax=Nonomuraea polychroma TaxID=46176 RepID=UPI003D8AEBC4
MASLLERLDAAQAATQQQLAGLREQMAALSEQVVALEERLDELAVARKVYLSLPGDDTEQARPADDSADHGASPAKSRPSALDPARTDRRARLPQHEADRHAAAWDDDDPEHQRKRDLLQTIVTRLVLTPIGHTKGRRALKHYQGDVGIDATVLPTWANPPRPSKGLASTEITAG